ALDHRLAGDYDGTEIAPDNDPGVGKSSDPKPARIGDPDSNLLQIGLGIDLADAYHNAVVNPAGLVGRSDSGRHPASYLSALLRGQACQQIQRSDVRDLEDRRSGIGRIAGIGEPSYDSAVNRRVDLHEREICLGCFEVSLLLR